MTSVLWSRWRFALMPVALFVLSVALVACGDGDDDDGASDGGAATSTATTADGQAAESPSGSDGDDEADAADGATDGGASDFQLGDLDDMESYRYEMTMEMTPETFGTEIPEGVEAEELGFAIEGAAVAPDRQQMRISADLGVLAFEQEVIAIGEERWARQDGGPWQDASDGALNPMAGDLTIHPGTVYAPRDGSSGAALEQYLQDHSYEEEDVRGIPTRRYDVTPDVMESFADPEDLFGNDQAFGEMRMTLWIAEDAGFPVQMRWEADDAEGQRAFTVEYTIFDINSDEIAIEPPA